MSSEGSNLPAHHRGLRIAAAVGAAVAVIVVGGGIAARASNSRHLKQQTDAQAEPVVTVSLPVQGGNSYTIDLPGRLQAYSRAPIYARVSGYLKDWHVDIGTPVHAGEPLADIEAPDLDQQLAQGEADLLTAQANSALARTTAARWKILFKTNSVSQQDVDARNGDLAAKEAIAKATAANVDRLKVLEGFKRIVAPFDGTVTARFTDIGALINAGSGSGLELFVISDTHKLRLYVNVPQNYATRVVPGTQAQLTVPERPGRTFTATVEASARSVDPSSGSTLVQLAVDNASGELFPGAYSSVHFNLPLPSASLNVPAGALVFDHRGLQVATLGPDNRVIFKPVKIARDLGDSVEISSGLTATDRIIDGPPDGIASGDMVRIGPGSTSAGMVAAAPRPVTPPRVQ
jgi:RND family efflux transporter MFP subunit